jgi:hypothetical protein
VMAPEIPHTPGAQVILNQPVHTRSTGRTDPAVPRRP